MMTVLLMDIFTAIALILLLFVLLFPITAAVVGVLARQQQRATKQ